MAGSHLQEAPTAVMEQCNKLSRQPAAEEDHHAITTASETQGVVSSTSPPESPTTQALAMSHNSEDEVQDDENDVHDQNAEVQDAKAPAVVTVSASAVDVRRNRPQHPPVSAARTNGCELPPEESFPTPIISNRGLLDSPPPPLILPLQLPATTTEMAPRTASVHTTATTTTTSNSSSGGSARAPRFSSLHEPPIQCHWPSAVDRKHRSRPAIRNISQSTPTNMSIPPEISIPVVPAAALTAMESTAVAKRAITEPKSFPDKITGEAAVSIAPLFGRDYPYSTLLQLLWKVVRMVSAGYLPRHPLWQWLTPPIATIFSGVFATTAPGPPVAMGTHRQGLPGTALLAPSSPQKRGTGKVQGLPSFGQTCFLNATVQSLASVEAFELYLSHMVDLLDQKQQQHYFLHHPTWPFASDDEEQDVSAGAAHEKQNMPRILYNCLQLVNGVTAVSGGVIDTRPLLREIALRHEQFRTMGSEQQDAQEFLTALLDSIVSEGGITSSTFLYPNSFVSLQKPMSSLSLLWTEEDEDATMTVVSGHKQLRRVLNDNSATRNLHTASRNQLPSMETSLSISNRTDFSTRHTSTVSNHSTKGSRSTTLSKTSDIVVDEPILCNNIRHVHNGVHVRPEEKKQEHFELHIPKVASEEEMFRPIPNPPPLHHVMGNPPIPMATADDNSLSTTTSSKMVGGDNLLPVSMEIMRTTTTVLSPSPLTGWMGSSLQCRTCGHVRPIRNAPFGDWSITPTAVSDGWLQGGDKVHHSTACRLEECLAEYVRVEHVENVECRYCTLQNERSRLAEEIQMTQSVLDGLLAKTRRQGKGATKDSCHDDHQFSGLLQELQGYRSELYRLQGIDPDDDQQDIFLYNSCSDSNAIKPTLLRSRARKRMFLTRLPAILCIHVQRRFFNPATDRMTKVTQTVIFPEILDVAPYCAYGGLLGGSWAGCRRTNRLSKLGHKPIHYQLQAVMEHRGSAFSGHYVCFRRDKTKAGWLFISDHVVRRVSWEQVQHCQAYMLFYEAL